MVVLLAQVVPRRGVFQVVPRIALRPTQVLARTVRHVVCRREISKVTEFVHDCGRLAAEIGVLVVFLKPKSDWAQIHLARIDRIAVDVCDRSGVAAARRLTLVDERSSNGRADARLLDVVILLTTVAERDLATRWFAFVLVVRCAAHASEAPSKGLPLSCVGGGAAKPFLNGRLAIGGFLFKAVEHIRAELILELISGGQLRALRGRAVRVDFERFRIPRFRPFRSRGRAGSARDGTGTLDRTLITVSRARERGARRFRTVAVRIPVHALIVDTDKVPVRYPDVSGGGELDGGGRGGELPRGYFVEETSIAVGNDRSWSLKNRNDDTVRLRVDFEWFLGRGVVQTKLKVKFKIDASGRHRGSQCRAKDDVSDDGLPGGNQKKLAKLADVLCDETHVKDVGAGPEKVV